MRSADSADSPALAPAQPTSPLRLFVLGSFCLERDGTATQLPTRKTESLLAFLALHSEPHAREKLAALFWGDSPDELARRSLRTALASLRKELGDDAIVADREVVQSNPSDHVWVDGVEFQGQAAQFLANDSPDSTTINFDLYRGELLADFYDEWIFTERERLHTLYLDSLLRLTQSLRTQSEYSRAIETARRVLAIDTANEQAHQQIMFCHWSLGDRTAALKQFDECKRALQAELGVEPSEDTVALYERIKQASIAGPSPATANTNLPIPLTSFVGREREMATVKQLLGTTRLLTLTGVGGCGKTRLAIRVARDVLDQFADGVWWVELAAAREDERVLQLAVKALGISETGQLSPLDTLLNYLQARHVLLVIDNCERLVKACASLAETILSRCPHMRILTTSREALSISGEIAWLVPSLSVPASDDSAVPAHLLQAESVLLFVERAMAVRQDFALTPANAQAVAHICRRLDGIPLAIELAVTRIKALTVEQINARLDDRFGLLTTGSRTALPRQQTLRATIDWSYELLSSAERALLRRLSVFSGGWTLEAAESVCAGGDVERAQVLDVLTHLTEKSLVTAMPQAGETRFGMLETIRQYAHEKLRERSEYDVTRDRHLAYCLNLAEAAEIGMRSDKLQDWSNQLEQDLDNMRTALTWSCDRRQFEAGLRLAGALWLFWCTRERAGEGLEWVNKLLDAGALAPAATSVRAKVLYGMAMLMWRTDEVPRMETLAQESLSLSQKLKDPIGIAFSLIVMGYLPVYRLDYQRAHDMFEEALDLLQAAQHMWGVGFAKMRLGELLIVQGEFVRGEAALEESLSLFRTLDWWSIMDSFDLMVGASLAQGNFTRAKALAQQKLMFGRDAGQISMCCRALRVLGHIALQEGDYGRATEAFEQCIAQYRQAGCIWPRIAYALADLGLISLLQSDYDAATHRFNEALAFYQETGYVYGLPLVELYLGYTLLAQGDPSSAHMHFQESVKLSHRFGIPGPLAVGLAAMGCISQAQAHVHRAVRLCGFAAKFRGVIRIWSLPAERADYERTIADAQSRLDDPALAAAWTEGQAMTLEQAVEEAMRV